MCWATWRPCDGLARPASHSVAWLPQCHRGGDRAVSAAAAGVVVASLVLISVSVLVSAGDKRAAMKSETKNGDRPTREDRITSWLKGFQSWVNIRVACPRASVPVGPAATPVQ